VADVGNVDGGNECGGIDRKEIGPHDIAVGLEVEDRLAHLSPFKWARGSVPRVTTPAKSSEHRGCFPCAEFRAGNDLSQSTMLLTDYDDSAVSPSWLRFRGLSQNHIPGAHSDTGWEPESHGSLRTWQGGNSKFNIQCSTPSVRSPADQRADSPSILESFPPWDGR